MRYGKKDANHNDIVLLLRQIPGVTVFDFADVGSGMTDIIIGYKGVNYLVEIKDGRKVKSAQKLTPAQIEFHRDWKGQKAVCNCFEQVLEVIGIRTGA